MGKPSSKPFEFPVVAVSGRLGIRRGLAPLGVDAQPMLSGGAAKRNRNACAKVITHRLFGKDLVHQQRRALHHAPRATAGAKAPSFSAERHQALGMAGLAPVAHGSQETGTSRKAPLPPE